MTVYFIQEQGGNNLIKIGKAKIFNRRYSQIKSSHPLPLKVLGVMPGSKREERILHKVFSDYRRNGEWFEPCDLLISFIKSHTIKPKERQRLRHRSGLGYGINSAEKTFIDTAIYEAVLAIDFRGLEDGDVARWYAITRPIVRSFSSRMSPNTARKHVNRAYYKIHGKIPPAVLNNRGELKLVP